MFLKRGLSHCCSIENVWEIRPEIGQKIANGWLLFLALLYMQTKKEYLVLITVKDKS